MGQGLGCKAGAQLWVDQTVGKKAVLFPPAGEEFCPLLLFLAGCLGSRLMGL